LSSRVDIFFGLQFRVGVVDCVVSDAVDVVYTVLIDCLLSVLDFAIVEVEERWVALGG